MRVCRCGRHVRDVDARCPFCAARQSGNLFRPRVSRCSRGAALVGVATFGIACGARTTLDTALPAADAGVDCREDALTADISVSDAVMDVVIHDAVTDIVVHDAVDECAPAGSPCITDSDCCDFQCGFGDICGAVAPPYGGTPPPHGD